MNVQCVPVTTITGSPVVMCERAVNKRCGYYLCNHYHRHYSVDSCVARCDSYEPIFQPLLYKRSGRLIRVNMDD
jgi:hypothetical protein